MDKKNWFQSKRLWAGVIAVLTGVSLVLTGEQTYKEVVPELIMTGFGLVQLIIGLMSGKVVDFGGKTLYRGKD